MLSLLQIRLSLVQIRSISGVFCSVVGVTLIALETLRHSLLISCIDFDIIRQNFYTASNLKDLFHNIHPKRIISFVHSIGLTNKL